MKKIAATIIFVMIMAFSVVSASAVSSPTQPPVEPGTKAPTQPSSTSPKTGTTQDSSFLYAALAVIACGGIAVFAKKRIAE